MTTVRTLQQFVLIVAGMMAGNVRGDDPPLIANPSFEESGNTDAVPRGWHFHGPVEAAAGASTADTPFHEKRALRIDARHGTQHWECDPIAAEPRQKYLLHWQARFDGEKSWRFRADFCGVEVEFRDAQGKSLRVDRQHTHCWKTDGWQPAWFLFTTPAETASLVVRFAIRTNAALPGGFDIDALVLHPMPKQSPSEPGKHLLNIQVNDEHGRPTSARIRVVDASGQPIVPAGAISYSLNGSAFHPLEEGECRLEVPPGRYSVTVTKGFEYRPLTQIIDIADSNVDAKISLERAWDWRRRGWYCGDHHTHLHRHGGTKFPSLAWRDVLRAARSEGLDFLPFMGADKYSFDADRYSGELSRNDFAVELTDEMTEDFWGHVCPVNVDANSRNDPRHGSGPMNFDRDAAIAAGGGVLCYAHPYGPMSEARGLYPVADPSFGLIGREFPIDLALGMRCGFDLLTMEGDQNQLDLKLRDLYRLYNLGFRPAITASTDFHIDQGRQPIGSVRTYVRSDSLDMPHIAAGYRNGHTFATNGPLIDLKVNGKGPGDEIDLPHGGEKVSVSVEAVSIGKLDRVEIIVNGKTFHTFQPAKPHRISGTCEVPAVKSLWIAAKAIGPEDSKLAIALEGRPLGAGQIAHTSPVYLILKNKTILAAQPSDAAYFIGWCDAAQKAWRVHLARYPVDAQYDKVVSERIPRARKVFTDLQTTLRFGTEK